MRLRSILSLALVTGLLVGGSLVITKVAQAEEAAVPAAAPAEGAAAHGEAAKEGEHEKKAEVAAPAGGSWAAAIPWKSLFAVIAIVGTAMCTAITQIKIGTAGAATIVERPETAAMFIVFVAIPETIVILGFVVAAMLVMF